MSFLLLVLPSLLVSHARALSLLLCSQKQFPDEGSSGKGLSLPGVRLENSHVNLYLPPPPFKLYLFNYKL